MDGNGGTRASNFTIKSVTPYFFIQQFFLLVGIGLNGLSWLISFFLHKPRIITYQGSPEFAINFTIGPGPETLLLGIIVFVLLVMLVANTVLFFHLGKTGVAETRMFYVSEVFIALVMSIDAAFDLSPLDPVDLLLIVILAAIPPWVQQRSATALMSGL